MGHQISSLQMHSTQAVSRGKANVESRILSSDCLEKASVDVSFSPMDMKQLQRMKFKFENLHCGDDCGKNSMVFRVLVSTFQVSFFNHLS